MQIKITPRLVTGLALVGIAFGGFVSSAHMIKTESVDRVANQIVMDDEVSKELAKSHVASSIEIGWQSLVIGVTIGIIFSSGITSLIYYLAEMSFPSLPETTPEQKRAIARKLEIQANQQELEEMVLTEVREDVAHDG